jgi:hypothetical protein
MNSVSDLHAYARAFAAKGLPVFLLQPGTKIPFPGTRGHLDATTDPSRIDDLFKEHPDANYGLVPDAAGYCVIDTDGELGEGNLSLLELAHDPLPPTFTVRTPRGGRHLYFKGKLPKSEGRLATKIDTRGAGYLVGPGCVIDARHGKGPETWGTYTVEDERGFARLPTWPAEQLKVREREHVRAAVGELDKPENVARAAAHLRNLAPAVQGETGDAHTYEAFCAVRELGVTLETAVSLALKHYNPRCDPQWDEDELRTKAANAYSYGQNDPGAWALDGGGQETFGEPVRKLMLLSAADAAYPAPMAAADLASGAFKPAEHLIQKLLLLGLLNLLYGDGGAGKTMLALNLAVAVALGRPIWGLNVRQMPVLLVLAEDDYGPIKQRLEGICALFDCELADLPLAVWCLPGHDLCLAHIADDGTWEPGPFLAPLEARLAAIGPCLLVLDTVSDIAALNENLRPPVNTLCKVVLTGLCQRHGVTVLANAHPSKAAMETGAGYAGSTAWNNAVRNRLTLKREDATSNPRRVLTIAKNNYGHQGEELELFQVGMTFATKLDRAGADREDALIQSAVRVALQAAQLGSPITAQKAMAKWQVDTIAADLGYRPRQADIKNALASALPRKLLFYVHGTNRHLAGYYPPDEPTAREMARNLRSSDGGGDV